MLRFEPSRQRVAYAVTAPTLANAYRPAERCGPHALSFIVMVVVVAAVFVIPVAAVTVPDVAIPRSVLLLIVSVAPEAALRMPKICDVAPVVEVSAPELERLRPERV